MKIGIIGSGVTGLSVARLLSKKFTVQILEKNDFYGGIARTKSIDGVTYHTVGGHCFNSKYEDVLDFVFTEVLPVNEWRKVKRISKVRLSDYEIDYPIEFSLKQIYKYDPSLAIKIAGNFFNNQDDGYYENLENWFRKKFGNTLAEIYFIPYNTKIWNNIPQNMDYSWVVDKLPIPSQLDLFESLISDTTDKMPHFEFYYPKSNDQNTFLDALAKDLDIIYNTNVDSIKFGLNGKWVIDNFFEYDILINTSPLNDFPLKIDGIPDTIIRAAKKLKYNSISTVLWKTLPTDKTWTYLPEHNLLFHRYIHIGNYFYPTSAYSISESVGKIDFKELVINGKRNDPFLLEAVDYHQSEYAYVVFDENYAKSVFDIKNYLKDLGIYTIGRFGDWQYHNMDVCIKQSIDLSKKIINRVENGKSSIGYNI